MVEQRYRLYVGIMLLFFLLPLLSFGAEQSLEKASANSALALTAEELAWLKKHPSITLGFTPNFEPLLIAEDQAEPSGILIDIYRELERLTGLNIKIDIDSWPESVKKAKKGQTDGLLSSTVSAARSQGLLSSRAMVYGTATIFVRKNSDFSIADKQDLIGKRIAVLRGLDIIEKILAPIRDKVEVIETNSALEMLRLLQAGQVDVAYGLSYHNYTIARELLAGIVPVYQAKQKSLGGAAAIRSDWPELVSIIDKSLKAMGPAQLNAIAQKWLPGVAAGESETPAIDFTGEERAWLDAHPAVPICVDPAWMPFEQINDKGEHEGMVADYMTLISERIGVSFRLVATETFADSVSKVSSGDCRFLSSWAPVSGMEDPGLPTSPYLSVSAVLAVPMTAPFISEHDDLKGLRIGVVANYPTQGKVAKHYPKAQLVLVNSVDEGLRKLSSGEIDAFAATQTTLGHAIQAQRLTNVKLGGVIPGDEQVRMVVNRNEPLLVAILDKAIASITREDRQRVANKWFSVRFERGIDYRLIWQIVALAAGTLLIIIVWNLQLKRIVNQRTAELRESEEKYRRIFESVEDGYLLVSMDGTIISVNPATARLLKFDSPLQLQGMNIAREVYADAGEREELKLLLRREGVVKGHLLHFKRRDGKQIIAECNLHLLFDDQDKPSAIEGTFRDATERFRAEEELRNYRDHLEEQVDARTAELQAEIAERNEAEQRLEYVFNATRDGIWDWDMVNDRAYCSPIYFQMLGYEAEEFPGNDSQSVWLDLVHPDDLQRVLDFHEEAFHSDERFSNEFRMRCKDGSYKWLFERGQIVARDTEGNATRMVGAHADIDPFKELERQLREAKEAAEAANQAKSTFLANMSHELRTPLNAILGFSEMIEHDQNTPVSVHQKISVINRSGEHLLSMINDVLDLSKIEAGRVELEWEVFDLRHMLEDIGQIFKQRAESAGLQFNLDLAPELPAFIESDVGKLRQILINLLGNAVKFTEKGGLSLRVRTLPVSNDAAKTMLQLGVQNSGPGIAEDQLDRIFEPFVQAGNSPGAVKGTGLGLAITRSFVELMGGSIDVESEVGKGALFHVQIPVALAEVPVVNGFETTRPEVVGQEPGQTSWRILIVEDNIDNRLLLSSLMQQAGFEIREAENGEEAIALFKHWQPHFIWMDMSMPVMDGYEATAKIRQLPGGEAVKIVAITASAFKEQRPKILAAGCDEVVHKPFKAHEVFDAMQQLLGVHYRYEEKSRKESEGTAVLPTAEMMVALPEELKQALKQSAQVLDTTLVGEVIESIRVDYADIADGLQMLVNDYRFDAIQKLLNTSSNSDEK